jgi:hypothetical protein
MKKHHMAGIGAAVLVVLILIILQAKLFWSGAEYTLVPGQDLDGKVHYAGLKQDVVLVTDGVPRRLVNQSSFSIVISTGRPVENATVFLDAQGNGEIYVQGQEVRRIVYSPKWKNYTTVATYDNLQVQIRNDKLSGYASPIEQPDVYTWLYANAQPNILISDDDNLLDWARFENNEARDIWNKTDVNVTLRGSHTFYMRPQGSLVFLITKNDLNMYSGADNLTIEVYDLRGHMVANATVPDDGIVTDSKVVLTQQANVAFENLTNNVYKVIFKSGADPTYSFTVNTGKITIEKSVFVLAPSSLYLRCTASCKLSALTYHREGLQMITVGSKKWNVSQVNVKSNLSLPAGEYTLQIPKGDVIISGFSVASFEKKSYFEPLRYGEANDGEVLVRSVAPEILVNKEGFENTIRFTVVGNPTLSLGETTVTLR